MNSTTLKIDFCEKFFFGSYGPISMILVKIMEIQIIIFTNNVYEILN